MCCCILCGGPVHRLASCEVMANFFFCVARAALAHPKASSTPTLPSPNTAPDNALAKSANQEDHGKLSQQASSDLLPSAPLPKLEPQPEALNPKYDPDALPTSYPRGSIYQLIRYLGFGVIVIVVQVLGKYLILCTWTLRVPYSSHGFGSSFREAMPQFFLAR